ncbi:MAG: hypothetical protein A2X56_06315 [Nitrospirae bacterium GWC2_57_13]|jgi:periplasmic nitrate reductase NapD|nr:MAG: hypothetical protein A2X56_06315 [Nitrospirae bacterium GWC2_57_13]OGW42394.1 MAG: hypothetical protein A2X57_05350 [Nitrospirae bacterium GWD2_57_8]HAS52783.1 nitrate reductase [Nitrospiraceae bacterium]
MNVSSLVVKTAPERMEEVAETLKRSGLCDVFFQDPGGTIIVTVEGNNGDEEIERMKVIQQLPYVLSVGLAYAYSEDELEEARERIRHGSTAVPERLKERE